MRGPGVKDELAQSNLKVNINKKSDFFSFYQTIFNIQFQKKNVRFVQTKKSELINRKGNILLR